jgi:hypothetical protein
MKTLLARAMLILAMLLPWMAQSQVSLHITIAPPPLPIYVQPQVPGEGYIWTPGYWAWSPDGGDYYWVPGTWVRAPNTGDLWTPGYWAFENAAYFWRVGYWGRSVGYYGGLNYGHGYTGSGYQGGHWDHGNFRYNRAASHVDSRFARQAYDARVVNHAPASRVSFHGGPQRREGPAAGRGGPTVDQLRHEQQALTTPAQRASNSQGVPPVAATRRPSEFAAPGVERAHADPGLRHRPSGPALPAPQQERRPRRDDAPDRGDPRQDGPRR